MTSDIEAQFEAEWEILQQKFQDDDAIREHFGAGEIVSISAEMLRAAFGDARPYFLCLALGEAPGRVVLDLCRRRQFEAIERGEGAQFAEGARRGVH